jgi:hypothetical protein
MHQKFGRDAVRAKEFYADIGGARANHLTLIRSFLIDSGGRERPKRYLTQIFFCPV